MILEEVVSVLVTVRLENLAFRVRGLLVVVRECYDVITQALVCRQYLGWPIVALVVKTFDTSMGVEIGSLPAI